MRRIHPLPQVDITDEDFRRAYAPPSDATWVRGSFVSTLDGVMRGPDGSSRSVASDADRRVFSMLRSTADVILIGAGTLRNEDYPPSRLPVAVVSESLRLPPTLRLFTERADGPRTLVLTSAQARAHAPSSLGDEAELVACGSDHVDLALAVAALAERGLTRIHCEGGPHLLGGLARAGLLDELLVTVTPQLVGGPAAEHLLNGSHPLDPAFRLTTTQVLEEDGSVFISARRAIVGIG